MLSLDLIGYLACLLVFATFYMRAMVPLRLIAIGSNIAFMAYGYLGGMMPILLLHAGLLPLNVRRLHQALRSESKPEGAQRIADPPSVLQTVTGWPTIDRNRFRRGKGR